MPTRQPPATPIDQLLAALHRFRAVYAELPLQQLGLFLEVARQDGISMPELIKQTGMPQGSLSRNIKALDRYPHRGGLAGHGLLERRQDLANRRARAIFLTAKGRQLVAELEQALGASPAPQENAL